MLHLKHCTSNWGDVVERNHFESENNLIRVNILLKNKVLQYLIKIHYEYH